SKIAPMPGPHKIYYGNSGTEAVEAAFKLARYHTKRPNVIAFFGAFHGRTMGAVSLTASKPQQKRRFAPLVPGVTHIPFPDIFRKGEQDALACARFIEDKLFKTILAPEEVAAIFVEPVQGEGGYVIAPTIFMQELRRICDRHGILLVADEVQSGMGRTGKWWAIEHAGVQPDIVCVEIVKDKQTKEYAGPDRDRIVELAFERGVLFLGCGPSTIRLAPPLVVTKDEADVALDVLDECIKIVGDESRKH